MHWLGRKIAKPGNGRGGTPGTAGEQSPAPTLFSIIMLRLALFSSPMICVNTASLYCIAAIAYFLANSCKGGGDEGNGVRVGTAAQPQVRCNCSGELQPGAAKAAATLAGIDTSARGNRVCRAGMRAGGAADDAPIA